MELSVRAGQIGPYPDDQPYNPRGDNWGSLAVSTVGPAFLEWARRGYVYSTNVSPAAPAAVPIYSTATNSPTLWNPADSGKMIVPIRLNMNMGAFAGIVVGGFALAQLLNTGSAVGTAAPFSVFTNIVPLNCLLGGPSGKGKFSGAAVTFTVQPTVFMELGLNQLTDGTEANFQVADLHYDFNGMVVMPPGTSISLVGVVASVTTWVTSFVFAELPIGAITLP